MEQQKKTNDLEVKEKELKKNYGRSIEKFLLVA